MITLLDIVIDITKKIKGKFINYKVYADKIDKITTPAFMVKLIPGKIKVVNQMAWDRLLEVDVIFFPENRTVEEMQNIEAELMMLFMPCVQIKDRYITLNDIDVVIEDDIMHFLFKIEYRDSREEMDYELMQNLYARFVNEDLQGGN